MLQPVHITHTCTHTRTMHTNCKGSWSPVHKADTKVLWGKRQKKCGHQTQASWVWTEKCSWSPLWTRGQSQDILATRAPLLSLCKQGPMSTKPGHLVKVPSFPASQQARSIPIENKCWRTPNNEDYNDDSHHTSWMLQDCLCPLNFTPRWNPNWMAPEGVAFGRWWGHEWAWNPHRRTPAALPLPWGHMVRQEEEAERGPH